MGGMGEVFLALDAGEAGLDRFVALKCMHLHLHDEPRVVEMFYREARLGSLFRHRNLVRVDDAKIINGRHTMVMEFAPGLTLRAVLDRLEERHAEFPTHFVLDITRQLADALWHAHNLRRADGKALGIVHRDLSPDNVLIGFDGVVRLIDFGVAAAATASNDTGLAGKVAYMSPEQCRGEVVDARSDLYALGTMYWEMLQGHAPYPRTDRILALRAIIEKDLPSPASTSGREFATDLDSFWLRLHAKDPNDRYPDAKAVGNALELLGKRIGARSNETVGQWLQKLFPHESAELQTICEKILRAPEPTENTVDLTNESFFLESDGDPTTLRSGNGASREAPPPAPVPRGSETAQASEIWLSETEFTSIQQVRRWRFQRNLLILAATVLLAALAVVILLWNHDTVTPSDIPVTFVVRAHPANAELRANGELVAPETPAIIAAKVDDYFELELTSPGYLPAHTSFWVQESLAGQGMDIYLEPDRASPIAPIGEIRVHYAPPDARLSINGVAMADASPALVQNIPLNTLHTLRLQHDGYQTLFVDLSLPSDAPLEFDLQMVEGVPLARLSVESVPSGAVVIVDGQEVGVTPLTNLELPAHTTYALQLRSAGFREWRRGVMLQGDDQRVEAQLEREPARSASDNAPSTSSGTGKAGSEGGARSPSTSSSDLPYRMLE